MNDKIMRRLCFVLCMVLCIAGLLKFYNFSEEQLADGKQKPILFGSTYMTLNNPFFDVINEEMRNVIEANGDVLITMDPQLSLGQQGTDRCAGGSEAARHNHCCRGYECL